MTEFWIAVDQLPTRLFALVMFGGLVAIVMGAMWLLATIFNPRRRRPDYFMPFDVEDRRRRDHKRGERNFLQMRP